MVVSPVKAILATRELEASGLPASRPKPLTMFSTPGGSRSRDQSSAQTRMLAGVCSAGFNYNAVACGKSRREFPGGHQEREVPGDDLADDPERLVKVVGNGILVNFGDRAFLSADAAREVAPMVDGERQIGCRCFANGLAVIPGLSQRQEVEIVLHSLRDLVKNDCPVRWARVTPRVSGLVCCVERRVNIKGIRAWDFAERLSGNWRYVFEVLAGSRLCPLATNVIAITGPKAHLVAKLAGMCRCQGRHRRSSGEFGRSGKWSKCVYRSNHGSGNAEQKSYLRAGTARTFVFQ